MIFLVCSELCNKKIETEKVMKFLLCVWLAMLCLHIEESDSFFLNQSPSRVNSLSRSSSSSMMNAMV